MTDTPNATPEANDATDMANTDMDDILSSIKNTVEEETAKAEDGVLTLDAADMMDAEEGAEAPAQIEERIDLDAFTESGDVNTEEVDINKADILDDVVGVAANPPKPDIPESAGDPEVENADAPLEVAPAAEESTEAAPAEAAPAEAAPAESESEAAAAVDVDAMLAEAAPEELAPTEETPTDGADADAVDVDAMLAEAAPAEAAPEEPAPTAVETEEAGDVDIDAMMAEAAPEATPETAETESKPEPAEEEAATPEAEIETPDVEIEATTVTDPARSIELPATTTASGLQVGFPAEILAEALRPLVKGWVDENLQGIVEKLVKEELERLASE